MKNAEATRWIQALQMEKHPEGGYFSELYKCPEMIPGHDWHLATSIYFLLTGEEKSRFHRLKFDELWYYHAGDPITIYVIDLAGELKEIRLGTDISKGERPQAVIPAGCIFGAALENQDGFCLVGCMVCPGFKYEVFELMGREKLLHKFPQHKEIIIKLT
jgi:Uncharacterized conserved protein